MPKRNRVDARSDARVWLALPVWRTPAGPGDVRSRPLAAKRGRARRASLYRMSPIRPHGEKQVMFSGILMACWKHCRTPLDAADIAHDANDVLAGPRLVDNRLSRHRLEDGSVIDHGKEVARRSGEPTCSCRREHTLNALQIGQGRYPDAGRGQCARCSAVLSIASHGTIANLKGIAIAARQHRWLSAASARPSFAPTIRPQVLVAQPEFNQRRRVELATALALTQLHQNVVGEHT
jgi:hypothetical protein